MVSVDLGTPPAPPASVLDGLPRRLPLTLPELRLAAERAGGAPLPFEMAAATTTTPLDTRSLQATQTGVWPQAQMRTSWARPMLRLMPWTIR